MAERRMFNKTLLLSNQFTALSKNARLLYFFVNLQADDDGICGNSRAACRMCGCSGKALQELIDGGWLLTFARGEVAVTHWLIHNQIRKDRYKPSIYRQAASQLKRNMDGTYGVAEDGCHFGNQLATQDRIGKDSLDQDSIDQGRQEEESPFAPAGPACDDMDYEKVLDTYQRLCPKLAPCHGLTTGLREKIDACYREGYTWMSLPWIFIKANASLFLQGDNGRGWQADLAWLLDPAHLRAVEEGKYDA